MERSPRVISYIMVNIVKLHLRHKRTKRHVRLCLLWSLTLLHYDDDAGKEAL